jgi:hypothetical protein
MASKKEFEKWKRMNGAKPNQKVFAIMGRQDKGGHGRADIVNGLLGRGWHENKDENKDSMNFDMLWSWLFKDERSRKLRTGQAYNHFQHNGMLTTKDGLCRSLRDLVGSRTRPIFFYSCLNKFSKCSV